jgi:TonB-linked SusC/RagA family outer membrane protein
MKKLSLSLLVFFSVVGTILAQRNIAGKVTDAKGEAIIGANVLAKGTSVGTSSDADGNYRLSVPAGATTITVSYVGFAAQEIVLGASNVIDVMLADDSKVISDVVVTALGVSKQQKSLGYATQTIGGDNLKQSNTLNVIDALSGKVAGVQITSSSGAVGASSRIVLRGPTSLDGNNQALMVVDGLRIDNSEFNTGDQTAGVAQSNRGIDINPNDIENITVLKGAAASALYGVDGARGVLLITTKKGNKKGKGISVDFSSTYSSSEVNKLPELQRLYAKGSKGALAGNTKTTSTSWGPKMDTMFFDGKADEWSQYGNLVGKSVAPSGAKAAIAYDPFTVFQTGHGWNNNLSFTGGDADKMTYRLSLSDSKEEGVVPLNKYHRTNISASTRGNFADNKLHLNSSLQYIKSNSRRIQQGSNISGLMLGLLRTPPSFDNSNGKADPVNDPTAYTISDGRQRTYRAGSGYENPYWAFNNTPYTDEVNRLLGNIDLTYDFTSWLSVNGKIGTDVYQDNRLQKYEINSRTAPSGRVIDDRYTHKNVDAYLTFLGKTNLTKDISMGYTLGGNLYSSYLDNITVTGDGLASSGFVNLSNTATKNTGYYTRNQKSLSVLGSVDFGYKNYLYLGLTGRNDYVSNLIVPTKAFKAGDIGFFYPSANMSFVFSELLEQNWMNFGKLRLSYGVVGGGAPSPYQTSTIYRVPAAGTSLTLGDGWTDGLTFPYNGQIGASLSNTKGSTTLTPSKTTDLELGLETKLFKNRVSLEASWYTRTSSNQILEVPISSSTGFGKVILNTGSLKTKGFDVVLGLTPIATKSGFRWDINTNFTRWKTTVESLTEGVKTQFLGGFSGSGVYNIVGEEYGQLYGGVWQRANDGNKFNPDKPYNPTGDIIIGKDGYPLVDDTNRKIGNPNPKFLLGINNTFSFKGFTISGLIDIRQGGQMWNGTRGALNNFGMSRATETRGEMKVFEGIMEADGSRNTKSVPLDQSWYAGKGSGFGPVAEQFVEDASFIRLRQATLAYTLNPNWLKSVKVSNLTISFTGRNLWLKTKYTGVDPETSLVGSGNAQGLDYFNMPGTKSYAFGLSAKF